MAENGTHVTRAEMREALDPIRKDIGEIKGDVKSLLLARAANSETDESRRRLSSARLAYTAIAAALVGDFATILWHLQG